MDVYHILGVMSGSSLDAIDVACVRFEIEDGNIQKWQLVFSHAEPIPMTWRTRLAQLPGADLHAFFQADTDLGKFIGTLCKSLIDKYGIVPEAIASHGHTVLHHPEEGYTVQIGNAAFIATIAGCNVISDLRSNDIAAGGQGAPLAPVAEHYLFPGYDFYLNLGGIANLSSFMRTGVVRAWDICPANQLLNHLAQDQGLQYDHGGNLARRGKTDDALIEQLKQSVALPLHDAFSMDNTWVQRTYFPIIDNPEIIIEDRLASVTEFIATSIASQIDGHSQRNEDMRLLVSGGGAHNAFLVERIIHHLAPVEVIIPEASVIDFKEAMLMSVCGMLRIIGKPNAFASVTGAAFDTVNGRITPGSLMSR